MCERRQKNRKHKHAGENRMCQWTGKESLFSLSGAHLKDFSISEISRWIFHFHYDANNASVHITYKNAKSLFQCLQQQKKLEEGKKSFDLNENVTF